MKITLGTRLRHLIELLDGAVSSAYDEAGLPYRPRYTPVMRALMEREPLTIGEIAASGGTTQPAATQTVALMVRQRLVSVASADKDGRLRMVRLSKSGRELLGQLEPYWQATAMAAKSLDAELPYPLLQSVENALAALARKSFGERIGEARSALAVAAESGQPSPARTPKGVRKKIGANTRRS